MVAKDFDQLLARFGNKHTYQKWIIALVLCPTSFFVGFILNLTLFQMAVPEHWCHVPGRERTLLSDAQWKNLTIPADSGEYSSCIQYKIEWPDDEGNSQMPRVLSETQACQNGWDHNKEEFQRTWATEFGWLCDQEDNSKIIYSTFYIGSIIGTFVLLPIADKYTGRRMMYYIAMGIMFVSSLPLIWIRNFTAHVVLRFIAGMSYQANYELPYVIVLEFVAPEMRATAAMLSFVIWTIGMCCTSLVSWLVPRWDYLNFFSCIPSIICILYWWYLPESPRWLLAKGRISECADVILKIAKVNKRPLPRRSDLELELQILKSQEKGNLTFTHAFRYPNLRRNAILLFILFFNCFLTYSMVLLSINILPSNFFLSHFVLSFFEVPSNFLGWIMTQYLGRRCTLLSTIILTGTFTIGACFCLHDQWVLLTIVGFIKLFSTIFIYILFLLSAELFPTPVRASGFAWVFVLGLLGYIVSPYAITNGHGEYFPYLLIAGAMVVSLIMAWPLPETIGLPLPQTFHDANVLGEGRPLTTWIHHWNKSKYQKNIKEKNNQEELRTMKENMP